MLTSPSQLRTFLEESGFAPKKSLSQNFLIDGNVVDKIVRTADIKPGDRVLEIGPGPGAITERLLEAGAEVIAVEMDGRFAKSLKRLGNLQIYEEDILRIDLEKILEGPVKVVANLPFQITAPILGRLVPLNNLISSLTLVVQKEVALRMTSRPGPKEYSSLTVFLDFYAKSRLAFHISRNCFYPAPKVDSSVVHLELKKVCAPDGLFSLVQTAFGQRRKMIRSSLKGILSPEEIKRAGLSPTARPETLTVNNFLSLLFSNKERFVGPGPLSETQPVQKSGTHPISH